MPPTRYHIENRLAVLNMCSSTKPWSEASQAIDWGAVEVGCQPPLSQFVAQIDRCCPVLHGLEVAGVSRTDLLGALVYQHPSPGTRQHDCGRQSGRPRARDQDRAVVCGDSHSGFPALIMP